MCDKKRYLLHERLIEALSLCNEISTVPPEERVHFQPGSNIHLDYPCILYKRAKIDRKFANNLAFQQTRRYTVTAIYCDPDSNIADLLLKLPYSSHDRQYEYDHLYHDVFTIYEG